MRDKPRSTTPAVHLRFLREWCQQPLGQALSCAEQLRLCDILSDVFGYHLVVLDPACQPEAIASSRIRHRSVLTLSAYGLSGAPDMLGDSARLPLLSDSIDAFVLPHALELVKNPHLVLREIDRCLVAEGHLVVLGFNPFGWWGLSKLLLGWRGRVPWSLRFISVPRLKDWLSLLGFDVLQTHYLFSHPPWAYRTPDSGKSLLHRLRCDRWSFLAASYVLVARKRVATLTPIKPRWRPRRSPLAGGVAETGHGSLPRNG